MGADSLLCCWCLCLCYVDRRSTQARRRTKGTMISSHGRRMTRLCSCTARLSTLFLDIHHMVRVRVLLSDHEGSLSPPFPIFKSRPLYLCRTIPFHYACPYIGQKLCLRLLMTLLRPFTTPNESTRLVHSIAFLCSPATPFAIFICVSYPCFLF
jgi:hypothetical protein